ncbi:MAG TPA: glycosyltransferase [Longimicrobium sp.]
MRILIVTPAPATPLKPRVFGFALALAQRHDVHLAFVEELAGARVPTAIHDGAHAALRQAGVTLHALRWGPAAAAAALRSLVLTRLPLRAALFDQGGLRRQVRRLHAAVRPDVVHVDRARALSLVRGIDTPALVDLTDPVGWYLEERARGAAGVARFLITRESRRQWRYEAEIAASRRALCVASEFGASILRARVPGADLTVVPCAVWTGDGASAAASLPGSSPRVAFWGNLGYPPNVDAIESFVRDHWPAVRHALPGATLHVAGSTPHARVRRLARAGEVFIHPDVPHMPAFLRGCDLAVAPLGLCAGFSNKIAEAAVHGLPVVASDAACAGLAPALAAHVPRAAAPAEWADALARLWGAPGARRAAADRLRAAAADALSPRAVAAMLAGTYERLLAGTHPTPAELRN